MPTIGPSWLDPQSLLDSLGGWAMWGTAIILFVECGLFVFFLPGDSLLFTVGLLVGRGDIEQPLWLVCLVLTIAAFAGNVVGYEIGRRAGPPLFNRPDSRLFKQRYIDETVAFFDKYGARAVVLARFVPIVRTFITITAGVGRMDRRRFFTYSAIGAVLWATGVTVLGYFLGSVDFVASNLEIIALLIVFVSILPAVVEIIRARRGERNTDYDEPHERQRVLDEDVTG
ncbi:MAG TPA: VTT domain-containing protein [Actinomycetales bacterium]|jgi:membrane-associated protein